MIAKIKQGWYLYREYGRKLKHHGKLPSVFAVISVFVLLLVSVVFGTLNHYVETVQNNWKLRTLYVSDVPGQTVCEFLREKYAEDPEIEEIWMNYIILPDSLNGPAGFPESDFSPISEPVKNNCRQIRKQDDLAEDQMVIPKYLPVGITGQIDTTTVSGEQFVGKTVSIHYAGQTKEFVIVGTYDNGELLDEDGGYYISENAAIEIAEALGEENGIGCNVLVKDREKVKEYQKEISALIHEMYQKTQTEEGVSMGPDPSVYTPYSTARQNQAISYLQFVFRMAAILAGIALMWTGFGILLSQLKQLNLRKSEFGLLKAIGYQNRQLSGILRMEALMFSVRIFLIAGLLTVVAVLLYSGWVFFFTGGLYHAILLPRLHWIMLLLILLAAMGIPLAAYEFSARKLKEIVPIEALK